MCYLWKIAIIYKCAKEDINLPMYLLYTEDSKVQMWCIRTISTWKCAIYERYRFVIYKLPICAVYKRYRNVYVANYIFKSSNNNNNKKSRFIDKLCSTESRTNCWYSIAKYWSSEPVDWCNIYKWQKYLPPLTWFSAYCNSCTLYPSND